MRAENITGKNPNSSRLILGEILPLESPLSMVICPAYACNFKCNYCLQSLPPEKRGYITSKTIMSLELFKKITDDITKLSRPLRRLSFAGLGEPLLNRDISEMVKYAKENHGAESIEITTNGALLTRELSDKLIAAGLDMLRISIQGTTERKYEEVSNVKLNLDEMIQNIAYFTKQKEHTKVYVKIIDCALDGEADRNRFLEKFGDCCDVIGIETLIENAREIDYEALKKEGNMDKNLFGHEMLQSEICPQPFFTMMIGPGGEVSPCCSMVTPIVIGNAEKESIYDIWNGERFKRLRLQMLDNRKEIGKVCRECNYYKHMMYPEDVLDGYKDKLKNLLL